MVTTETLGRMVAMINEALGIHIGMSVRSHGVMFTLQSDDPVGLSAILSRRDALSWLDGFETGIKTCQETHGT